MIGAGEDEHAGGVVGGVGGEVACVDRQAGGVGVADHLGRYNIREGVVDGGPAGEADSAHRRGIADASIDPCVLL